MTSPEPLERSEATMETILIVVVFKFGGAATTGTAGAGSAGATLASAETRAIITSWIF
jgi:hypothetical protein